MTAHTPSRQSRWIPWTFVGGFGVVVLVNAVLIWFAVDSFSGVTVDAPYARGRDYNASLAEARRQAELGWRVSVEQNAGRVVARVSDRDGTPLDGLSVDGRLIRPVEAVPDTPLHFAGAGGGRYVAVLAPPKPGVWDVALTFQGRRPEHRLQRRDRLFVDDPAGPGR